MNNVKLTTHHSQIMTTQQLHTHLTKLFPKKQIFTDELYRLVKGTDAGLYQLIPKAVVEVIRKKVIPYHFAAKRRSSTFDRREQAERTNISDSILMEVDKVLSFQPLPITGIPPRLAWDSREQRQTACYNAIAENWDQDRHLLIRRKSEELSPTTRADQATASGTTVTTP